LLHHTRLLHSHHTWLLHTVWIHTRHSHRLISGKSISSSIRISQLFLTLSSCL
jgi:hypothetical protein